VRDKEGRVRAIPRRRCASAAEVDALLIRAAPAAAGIRCLAARPQFPRAQLAPKAGRSAAQQYHHVSIMTVKADVEDGIPPQRELRTGAYLMSITIALGVCAVVATVLIFMTNVGAVGARVRVHNDGPSQPLVRPSVQYDLVVMSVYRCGPGRRRLSIERPHANRQAPPTPPPLLPHAAGPCMEQSFPPR
jgi:hypothetical protein